MTVIPDAITLGAQTSAEDDRTMKHVLELRRLLSERCKGPYSEDVSEFALILRIGGDLNEFEFEGCEKIRRNRKARYITVDVGFPSKRWKQATHLAIRHFLAEAVETGLLCCLRRLEKIKRVWMGLSFCLTTPLSGESLLATSLDFLRRALDLLKSAAGRLWRLATALRAVGLTPAPCLRTASVIETQINDTFEGWDGETIFKLSNGQIWQQADIHHYAYRPKVLIYLSGSVYRMKVEGVESSIPVKRLK